MTFFSKQQHHSTRLIVSLLMLILIYAFCSSESMAMPSFARQTGQACSSCHTQSFGPNLTPMGRYFKLTGYTMGGGSGNNAKLPPISAMIIGAFTNTLKDQDVQSSRNPDAPISSSYNKNNNFTLEEVSLFYAGRIYGKVGAFSQLTYNGYEDKLEMDNTDIRFADQIDLFDKPITYGISLNNNPSVQDLWNTTPVWGFPYTGSSVQPEIGSSALIDGALGSQVGGATAYTMVDNLLYLEAGAYGSFSNTFQRTFGIPKSERISLDGAAPYWRVALQYGWKGHYFAVGHFGMIADVFPGRDHTNGADQFTDIGFDATYQYLANPKHIFEFKTAYIYEDQKLNASRGPRTDNTYLNTYKFNIAYTYDQTYGVTFGYNKITGSNDLDQTKPNSEYFTAELVYVPFGKSDSVLNPWLNLRTSLQYIGFSQANGSSAAAQNNNSFLITGWLAF